jgi:hypothetical protein
MPVQVLAGVTVDSVSNANQQNHTKQFNALVERIRNDLRQSGNVSITASTYHELFTWVIPKTDQSSYIGAVPEAEQLFRHLFGYLPENIINGRNIRDIDPDNAADAQLLEVYSNNHPRF